MFNKEYDVLSPVTEKTTETVNNTVDETGNNNTVDSSVTFNNGDFGNDTKQQRDSTGNRQETGTKTVVKTVCRVVFLLVKLFKRNEFAQN